MSFIPVTVVAFIALEVGVKVAYSSVYYSAAGLWWIAKRLVKGPRSHEPPPPQTLLDERIAELEKALAEIQKNTEIHSLSSSVNIQPLETDSTDAAEASADDDL